MEQDGVPGVSRILFSAVALFGVFLLSLLGLQPPAPKPVNAPDPEFSAGRAREVLARLLGDGAPHPTGSIANDAVRARILEEFSKLGYVPEVQTGFACDEYGTCATVNNVVARLDGAEPGHSVLLAAHYDSVPAGPGASDDGAGAATVLECARALKALPKPRHSIIFLIDDGEEAGLLGARVFVDRHRWAKDVVAAVNVDTRGTSGPSLMFETGSANYWIVRLYAKNARHPATNAFAYFAYKLLPNDTDFTVFKAAGYQGANFAYIGNVVHYHTPLDNFQNASPASLQHDGDNALPTVLALANTDLSNLPHREAAFFDVFEHWTVYWPASWTLTISIAATLLLFIEIAWLFYRKRLALSALLWGLFAWLAMIAVTAANAWILNRVLMRAGAVPVNWVAHPFAVQAAFWFLALAVVSTVAFALSRRAGFLGLWTGVWIWWALLSIVTAALTHGIAYLFPLCLCVAVLTATPLIFGRVATAEKGLVAGILPLLVAAISGFATALLLYSALGTHMLIGIAVVVALLLTPLAPFCADLLEVRGLSRIALPATAIVATVLAALASVVAPAFSAKSPERVNIRFWQDGDSGKSVWIVQPDSRRLPEPVRVAANFARQDPGPFPWSTYPSFLADAPHQQLAPPTFTILESSQEGSKRTYRALIRSERGAPDVMVLFPPDSGVESARMEGEPIQPETERVRKYLNGWIVYDCLTAPVKGAELSFTLPAGKPVVVYTLDESFGLPAEGEFLLKSRPLTATASSDGDISLVSRRVELLP
ncbi:MAG: M20/M25/M40 family metallo-hydrolase [Candidatus Acidiferrales bacterium]